jgi:hypothetical protein
VVKEHIILQEHISGEGTSYPSEHLSGEGTSYPSGAPKWRRNIKMFLLHLGALEG